MRSKRTTTGLTELEVIDVIFLTKRDKLRGVFYVNGRFNVYPVGTAVFEKVYKDRISEFIGIYDRRVSQNELMKDLKAVSEGGL